MNVARAEGNLHSELSKFSLNKPPLTIWKCESNTYLKTTKTLILCLITLRSTLSVPCEDWTESLGNISRYIFSLPFLNQRLNQCINQHLVPICNARCNWNDNKESLCHMLCVCVFYVGCKSDSSSQSLQLPISLTT